MYFGITVWHHQACQLMKNADRQEQIFPAHQIRISDILFWVRKSYCTHVILPRLSPDDVLERTHMVV